MESEIILCHDIAYINFFENMLLKYNIRTYGEYLLA